MADLSSSELICVVLNFTIKVLVVCHCREKDNRHSHSGKQRSTVVTILTNNDLIECLSHTHTPTVTQRKLLQQFTKLHRSTHLMIDERDVQQLEYQVANHILVE